MGKIVYAYNVYQMTLDNDLLSFSCAQLIACCANSHWTGCPNPSVDINRKDNNTSIPWMETVYYIVYVNWCQGTSYLLPMSSSLSLSDSVRIYYHT